MRGLHWSPGGRRHLLLLLLLLLLPAALGLRPYCGSRVRLPTTRLSVSGGGPRLRSPPVQTQLGNDKVARASLPTGLSRNQALALLLVISAVYGSNYAAIKVLDEVLDPFYSTIVRFALAAAVFVPAVLKDLGSGPDKKREILAGGCEIGLLNGFGYLFQAVSLEQPDSSTSTVAFVASLSCVVVPLLDFIIPAIKGREMPPLGKLERLLPALLALVGVGCLELYQDGGAELSPVSLYNAAAAAQPIFFGLAFWRLEKVIKRCTTSDEQAAFTGANLIVVLLVAFTFFVVSTLSDAWAGGDASQTLPALSILLQRIADQRELLVQPNIILALIWTGLITTAGATLLESFAVQKLTASEVSIIYTTEPLWGTAIAFAMLGESVGVNTWLGGVFISSACILSSLQGRRREESAGRGQNCTPD